jgi:hypothetical protein
MGLSILTLDSILKNLYPQQKIQAWIMERAAAHTRIPRDKMHFAALKQTGTDRKIHVHRDMVIAVEEWAPKRSRVFLDEEYNTALNEQGIQTPLIVEASAEEVFKLLSTAPFWGVASERD